MNNEPTREITSPTLEHYPLPVIKQQNLPPIQKTGPYVAINKALRCIIAKDLLRLIGEDSAFSPEENCGRFLGISFDPGTLELYFFPPIPNLVSLPLFSPGVSNPYIRLGALFKEQNLKFPEGMKIYKDRQCELVTLPIYRDGSVKLTALKMSIPESFVNKSQASIPG